jgi:hypothetical protein
MKSPQKMTMADIRQAIELLEDELLAGHAIDQIRLVSLMKERIRRVNEGLKSLR